MALVAMTAAIAFLFNVPVTHSSSGWSDYQTRHSKSGRATLGPIPLPSTPFAMRDLRDQLTQCQVTHL